MTTIKREMYRAPRLRVIELTADEVLGGGCKNDEQGAASQDPPCALSGCQLDGS